jgi:hypothetical protein
LTTGYRFHPSNVIISLRRQILWAADNQSLSYAVLLATELRFIIKYPTETPSMPRQHHIQSLAVSLSIPSLPLPSLSVPLHKSDSIQAFSPPPLKLFLTPELQLSFPSPNLPNPPMNMNRLKLTLHWTILLLMPLRQHPSQHFQPLPGLGILQKTIFDHTHFRFSRARGAAD